MRRSPAFPPRAALAAALLLAAPAAGAQDEGKIPLEIEVGKTASLCPCPVQNVLCDDLAVVALVDVKGEPSLRGLAPGKTTCSARAPTGFRRVYAVTVRPPKPPPKAPPPDGGAPGPAGGER